MSLDIANQHGASQARLATAAAVEVHGLTHAFSTPDQGTTVVVDDVSLVVPQGQFVSIVGPSGCGKTTVLNIIAGLEPLQAGRVSVLGQPARAGAESISMSFARDALMPWRTAVDNVALPLELRGMGRAERRERASKMLELVGLADYRSAYRGQLSQGMRQRVALARALVGQPRLLLLDEPFAALDSQTRVLVQGELLRMLEHHETPVTTLMVTHDLGEAIALSDQIVLMSRRPGRVRAVYPVDLPRPRDAVALRATHAYTRLYEEIWRALAQDVKLS